jgi:hypothetical protein
MARNQELEARLAEESRVKSDLYYVDFLFFSLIMLKHCSELIVVSFLQQSWNNLRLLTWLLESKLSWSSKPRFMLDIFP